MFYLPNCKAQYPLYIHVTTNFILLYKIRISLCDDVYHKSTMVFTAGCVYDLVQH